MRIVCFLLACAFSAQLFAQEVREICPQAMPPGWVVIGTRTCAGCCGAGMAQMLKIQRLDNAAEIARRGDDHKGKRSEAQPAMKRIEVCPQAVPDGWVVVSTRPCAGCCGPEISQMLTIEQVGIDYGRGRRDDHDDDRHDGDRRDDDRRGSHGEGLRGTANMEVCPQATPQGWVVIGGRQCAGCCNSDMSRMLTIKRIDPAPRGTRLEICPQETPPGWAVVGTRPCAGCCGTTEMEQMLTIEKL